MPRPKTQPFGLSSDEVARAWARTYGRPAGLPRYEAFAVELEAAATEKFRGKNFLAMPLAHSYAVLRTCANRLRALSEEALALIEARVPGANLDDARRLIAEYDEAVRSEEGMPS